MSYEIIFSKKGLTDIQKIKKSGQKINLAKVEEILEELKIHPTNGIGNPEPLKHNLSGFWSRRINKKDRLFTKSSKSLIVWL